MFVIRMRQFMALPVVFSQNTVIYSDKIFTSIDYLKKENTKS